MANLPDRPALGPYRGGIKFGLTYTHDALNDDTLNVVPVAPHPAMGPLPPLTDWISPTTQWGAMDNDIVGDCVVACMGHLLESWTTEVSVPIVVSNAEVLAAYSTLSGYNPNTGANDVGVDIGAAMTYWHQVGFGGSRIVAASRTLVAPARLSAHDLQGAVESAITWYGGAVLGLNLPAAAITHFNDDQPWVGNIGPGLVAQAHCVPALSFDQDNLEVITWGRVQRMDWTFLQTCVILAGFVIL